VTTPAAAIAVSTHDRTLRLRWLLNSLTEQTRSDFEVIVAHDSPSPETGELLRTHPLAQSGRLRSLSFPPRSVLPGAKRNAAWQEATANLILFTDDDCRPRADWVECAVAGAASSPGAILQGLTVPDPDESAVLRGAPWAHTVLVEPPTAWAETCNIAYPRELLARIDGFDPELRVGEDTDVAIRAREAGAELIGSPEMVVYHAVEEQFLPGKLRSLGRWRDMAMLVKRHPQMRRHMWGGIWWKPEHAALTGALAGAALACGGHRTAGAALALPWLALATRHRGYRPRGLLRSATELPGRAAIDATEMVVLAQGSARYRTLLL
jgi:glycosyltransferase involved in cell wall biosynthesis